MATSEVSSAKPAVVNTWGARAAPQEPLRQEKVQGGGGAPLEALGWRCCATWILFLIRVRGNGAGCVLPACKGHSGCWVESTSGNYCLTPEGIGQAWRHVKGKFVGCGEGEYRADAVLMWTIVLPCS